MPSGNCKRVINPAVALSVSKVLTNVIDGPYRGRTGAAMSLGRPAAGKTGTTDDNAAVWFVGYTPQLATAVWVGDPAGATKYPLRNVTINGRFYSQLYGATFAGPIWKSVMQDALQGVPPADFAEPDPGGGVNGIPVRVPNLANVDSVDAMSRLEELGLIGTVDPVQRPSALQAGTVLFTTPGAGARVRSGDTVRLVVSSGSLPQPVVPVPPSVQQAPPSVGAP